MDYRRLSSKTN